MKLIAAGLAALLLVSSAARAQEPPDPHIWLEDIDAARAMSWVEGQNARSAARLEGDRRYAGFLAEARAIFTAKDRIPMPAFQADRIQNLWQDEAHVHGLVRFTTLASYRTSSPAWDVALDLDKLSAEEGKNWFWKGADCLRPAQSVCLARLSNGGGDAVEIREFDTVSRSFVAGGFRLATGKQNAAYVDRDHVIAASPWTPEEVTTSGYAYIIKLLGRDGSARELFRGARTDVAAQPVVIHGDGGKADALMAVVGHDFYHFEHHLLTDAGPKLIPLPAKAEYEAYVAGQLVFIVKEPWRGFGAGAVISYDLAALKRGDARPVLVFQPGPRQAIQNVASTKTRLIVELLEDVKGAADAYAFSNGRWSGRRLPLPKDASIAIRDTADTSDQAFFTVESFLEPTSLWLADAAAGAAVQVKALPARFDASTHLVEQFWATSTDGAKIPYFVVRPKSKPLDGTLPTIMYGYGGFEVAKPPIYLPEMGKLWLERGGAYVIANIRGGGEFGPAWHEAVLREKRQLAFDDFSAVARDMSARRITSPRRLGIYGRSNGGVLTSVAITQHPEHYNAAVIESPLIDMLRYHKLSAGASWIGEYGDPDVSGDRAFIARYSAYQNLKAGMRLPEPYITTNTRDDRVHPGHARKFAAKMAELGYPYLYYEQTFGGHANDADPELNARRWARHYVYLAEKLMD